MIRRAYILCIMLTMSLSILAGNKKSAKTAMTVEQEQQFTYYWYAAKGAIEQQEYDKALCILSFCESLNPKDALTKEYMGIIYEAVGQEEKAETLFKQAYELDPKERWYQYTKTLIDKKDEASQKELMRALEKSMKLDPENDNLLETAEQVYLMNSKTKKAIATQDKIDAIKGYDGYSALNRYTAYIIDSKPRKALDAIDKYLQDDPNNLRFLQIRLQLLEVMKIKPNQLEEEYISYLHVDPNNLMVLNNYAWLLATHGGDLRKAEAMSQRTIREQPNNPTYLDTYGWIMHLQGQKTLALFYLHKALNNAPDGMVAEIQEHIQKVEK